MSRRIHCIFRVDPSALNRAARIISGCELGFAAGDGQGRVPDELKKRAISASPAGVRTIWPRRDLQTFSNG